MKNLLANFNRSAVSPDPEIQKIPTNRVGTEFYRTGKLDHSVINSRMYAFKQTNGRMALRLQQVDTFPDPVMIPNLLPDFMAAWFMPDDDKNLTVREALGRLQGYHDRKCMMGQTQKDFSFPTGETRFQDALKLL